MKFKKILSVLIASVVMLTALAIPAAAKGGSSPAMRDITTMELVRDMGIGINLGNTFESFGDWLKTYGDGSVESYETAWGSPVITQKMIQGYAKEGFTTLRVPVHWFNLMDDNYNISKEYTAAVKQVVDWATDAGLYVIVNIHHDENNFFADFATNKKDKQLAAYKKIWTQLAEVFRDYGDHLILESLNEEACWDSLWNRYAGNTGKAEAFALVNEINQAFVDVVRSSGGNNEKRHLLLAGYVTGIDETCDEMYKMPDDPANRCAVSIHYYMPSTFAILEEDADWGKARSTWGTSADFKELEGYMNKMKTELIDKGIPVILGEYGCPKTNKDPESVRLFLYSVCKAAYERNICPVLWDVTGLHYDRTSCKMYDSTLMNKLLSVVGIERDPEEATVITVGEGCDYSTVSAAVSAVSKAIKNKTASSAYNIAVSDGHTEKSAITFPRSDISFSLTGGKLIMKSPTITANSNLTISCNIAPLNPGKAVTVKCAAGKKVSIEQAGSDFFALSGTKTSDFVLNTGSVINVSGASAANITAAEGTTIKLTKGKFTPTSLSGNGILDVYDASAVTLTSVKNISVILNQYNKTSGKNVTVMLPKLTVGTAENMFLTVKDTEGSPADISGQTVMYLSKASADRYMTGITITNTDGDRTLKAVPYSKNVRAEWLDSVTMTFGGASAQYSSFDKAFEAMTANAGTMPDADYVISVNRSMEMTGFALPSKAGSLTINGNGNTLTFTGVTSVTAKYALSLNNICIVSQTKTGDEASFTITDTSSGNVFINDLAFKGKKLTIKGGTKNDITLGNCAAVYSLTGFLNTTVTSAVEIQKTLTAVNLTLKEGANIIIDNDAAVTVNKVFDAEEGAEITLSEGFRPISLKGTITGGKVSLIGVNCENKQIFKTKLDLSGKFDVSGISSGSGYDLVLESGKVYLRKVSDNDPIQKGALPYGSRP